MLAASAPTGLQIWSATHDYYEEGLDNVTSLITMDTESGNEVENFCPVFMFFSNRKCSRVLYGTLPFSLL